MCCTKALGPAETESTVLDRRGRPVRWGCLGIPQRSLMQSSTRAMRPVATTTLWGRISVSDPDSKYRETDEKKLTRLRRSWH